MFNLSEKVYIALIGILFCALVAVGSFCLYFSGTSDKYLNLYQQSQQTLTTANEQNKLLKSSFDLQQANLKLLQEQGKDLQEQMKKSDAEILKGQEDSKRFIESILTTNVPKDCKGAVTWAAKQGKELGKW